MGGLALKHSFDYRQNLVDHKPGRSTSASMQRGEGAGLGRPGHEEGELAEPSTEDLDGLNLGATAVLGGVVAPADIRMSRFELHNEACTPIWPNMVQSASPAIPTRSTTGISFSTMPSIPISRHPASAMRPSRNRSAMYSLCDGCARRKRMTVWTPSAFTTFRWSISLGAP